MIFSSPVISATLVGADAGDDLVVDLAREQPQRQADHADVVRQHALDGEMGLAGVGRAEHGGDAASALRACGIAGKDRLILTFVTSGSWSARTRNEGGTNPVRIADSAHSDFVLSRTANGPLAIDLGRESTR